ncbi:MAG: hypothetical protein V5A62_02395 [Haloarculaceae archaeon]
MVPDPSTETDPGDRRSRRSRRAMLATGATTAAALAGCSTLASRRLSSRVEHSGGGEMSVVYTAGSSEVATATFTVSDIVDGRTRFRPHISQELSGVESYRLRFRPVVDGSVPHFTVALERPGGYPFPKYRF